MSETTMTAEKPVPSRQRAPWNKGRVTGQKRPLKLKEVWTIRVRLQLEGRRLGKKYPPRRASKAASQSPSALRVCSVISNRIGPPGAWAALFAQ